MSIFKANKKYLSIAQTAMSNAQNVATQQQDINIGRELLTNIRQYRMQRSVIEQAEAQAEGVQISGMRTAAQFLQQQVNEPYQRAVDDAERQEQIAEYQRQAQSALKKFKKQAKTARTTGYVTSAVLGVAGGFLAGAAVAGGALGAAAAGSSTAVGLSAAGGAAVVGGLGGTAVGAIAGADSNYYGGVVGGTMTAMSIAGTAGSAGLLGGGSGAVVEAGGGASVTKLGATTISGSWEAAPITTALQSTWGAEQYMAVGSIMNTIGGAVKDINGYNVKVPITVGYTGQNYSQYVQSFRGFA